MTATKTAQVREVKTTLPGRMWIAESQTTPGLRHVIRFVDGNTTCTCNGSVHTGHCYHGASVERLLISEQDAKRAKAAPDRAIGMYLLTGGKLGSAPR